MSAPFYYERIVFLRDSEAEEPLQILDEHGEEKAIEFLSEWDYGDGGDIHEGPSYGTGDHTYFSGKWLLSYDLHRGYIGLEKRLTRKEQYQYNGTRPVGEKNERR